MYHLKSPVEFVFTGLFLFQLIQQSKYREVTKVLSICALEAWASPFDSGLPDCVSSIIAGKKEISRF